MTTYFYSGCVYRDKKLGEELAKVKVFSGNITSSDPFPVIHADLNEWLIEKHRVRPDLIHIEQFNKV